MIECLLVMVVISLGMVMAILRDILLELRKSNRPSLNEKILRNSLYGKFT